MRPPTSTSPCAFFAPFCEGYIHSHINSVTSAAPKHSSLVEAGKAVGWWKKVVCAREADTSDLNLLLHKVSVNDSYRLTSFPQVEIVSLVSASRLTTVERLIFICDLVNSKTLAEEARGAEAFGLLRVRPLKGKQPCCKILADKESEKAVVRYFFIFFYIYHLILFFQQPVLKP